MADGYCAFETEAVYEDPEASKEQALALIEQVVAPVDQSAQRLLTR